MRVSRYGGDGARASREECATVALRWQRSNSAVEVIKYPSRRRGGARQMRRSRGGRQSKVVSVGDGRLATTRMKADAPAEDPQGDVSTRPRFRHFGT
jgi:hypothetical protein